MKIAKILAQQITTNPKLKSNPIDQFIQKKIEKVTQISNNLKGPLLA